MAALDGVVSVGGAADGETAADDVDDRPLCTGDLLVTVGKLTQNPACEDLLEPAVEDPAREPRVELGAEAALRLPALDHALDDPKAFADLVDLPLEVGAAGDLTDHHAHQIGVVPPRAEQDLRDPAELLVGRLVGLLDAGERLEQLAPVLPEHGAQHRFLRSEVVVEETVGDLPPPRRCRRRARCGSRRVRRPGRRRRGSGGASPRFAGWRVGRSRAIERSVKSGQDKPELDSQIDARAAAQAPTEPERSRQREEIGDPVGFVRVPLIPVEQDRADSERAGTLDVVAVRVPDHHGLAGSDASAASARLEDRRVRLRAAVALRADGDVDVEVVVSRELFEVALAVGDQADRETMPRSASRTGSASS